MVWIITPYFRNLDRYPVIYNKFLFVHRFFNIYWSLREGTHRCNGYWQKKCTECPESSTVFISHIANTLWKGMNPTTLPLTMKIFNRGMATGLWEQKLWIQTSYRPAEGWAWLFLPKRCYMSNVLMTKSDYKISEKILVNIVNVF